MENKEKYSFYKQKLKKQTQSLLIISIIILIINIHFVTMNFTSASNMCSYFTVWDIKLLKYITIEIIIFISTMIINIISLIAVILAKKENFNKISSLLFTGEIICACSFGILLTLLLVCVLSFITLCIVTIMLAVPTLWDLFIGNSLIFFPICIGGIIWFIETLNIKHTIKNIRFYEQYK